jgi:SPOR domain
VSTAARRKAKRQATAAVKKQRRQKVFAFAGLGVLAILLLIQGPRMLELFRGSDTPVAAPAPAPVPVPPAPTAPEEPPALDLLAKAPSVDPFASRALADRDPQLASVSAPAGARDPFQQKVVAVPPPSAAPPPAALSGQIVLGAPGSPNAVAQRGWIVVVASIRTSAGRNYAERVAASANRRGLEVSVLDSSTRKPLRSGYFVVYTGPFESLSAAEGSVNVVRGAGFRTAYVRQLLVYSDS